MLLFAPAELSAGCVNVAAAAFADVSVHAAAPEDCLEFHDVVSPGPLVRERLDLVVSYEIHVGPQRLDDLHELPRVRAPFLVVQGDVGWAGERVDPDDDPSLALMRDAMPQLEVAVIPGAHTGYVLAQRPQDCAETVLDFLRRHPL